MIYLASPYTSADPAIEERRFEQVRDFVAKHFLQRTMLFSPIVYCHQFRASHGFEGDAVFWADLNRSFVLRASELWVLQLDGWQSSHGVQQEIRWAQDLFKPVVYKELHE